MPGIDASIYICWGRGGGAGHALVMIRGVNVD